MRDAVGHERQIAEGDLDVALRINSVVVGENYAALMKRSAENASLQLLGDAEPDDEDETDENAAAEDEDDENADVAAKTTSAA